MSGYDDGLTAPEREPDNPDPYGVEAARKFHAARGIPYDPDTYPEEEE